jgi:DNA-binding response OmpR family regulator
LWRVTLEESLLAKILIIDDEEQFAGSFGALLRAEGYEVVTSCDPLGFAELVQREKPDLALIDVLMPKMTGDRLVPLIRKKVGESCCPLLLWSSKLPEELELLAHRSGADGFLYKASLPDEVLQVIREYLP